ncbi:related to phospholipase C [Phialocephala subalpina]|uniref:Related to phospholipase C n=1 Tax=Phialocephala subalpina TaxID=576137 RepID=A0A1L7WKM8_9HELO|nr:related to phospholipase C [Phialocephala subalpina]
MVSRILTATLLSMATSVSAGGLKDIEHVVLFMQENRAFDHYFGTMSGVRGFSDPNVQCNPSTGLNTFQQKVNDGLSTQATSLLPFYINYLGRANWTAASQCASDNTAMSWTHFKRQDLPLHFALAEGWTLADMYQDGVIASTSPNRVTWMSGSINCPGGPQTPDQGGIVTDNSEGPGCESPGLNCEPLYWKTVPEFHEDAGVLWMVYQDEDNFGDDLLIDSFYQYQNPPADSPLTMYGASHPGLDKFYSDAAVGTLPQVSWIVGPAELSEHATYGPQDGAWLQKKILEAVVNGAAYNETLLMISYDETGGWSDHVTPFHSPSGTAGEWIEDPYGAVNHTYTGPGFRVPFTIISPWTRGGHVFTEHADHTSQILFMEEWLETLGYEGVRTTEIPAWRRAHMSNLVSAFDFDNPDYSIPLLPVIPTPSTNSSENYNAASVCELLYGHYGPPIPYGPENEALDPSTLSEEGFKSVRGYLTEGRYLVFEMNGYTLTNPSPNATDFVATKARLNHEDKKQRWVVHATGGTATDGGSGAGSFNVSSAVDGRWVKSDTSLGKGVSGAETYRIEDFGNGKGYTLVKENGKYLTIDGNGMVDIVGTAPAAGSKIWSVTYIPEVREHYGSRLMLCDRS